MNRLIAFSGLLLLSLSLQAQTPAELFESQLLQQINALNVQTYAPSGAPVARQYQSGYRNEGTIEQVQQQGAANTALLIQSGQLQQATMQMTGAGNEAAVIQEGARQQYNLQLHGDHIETQILQQGYNNSIDQTLAVDGLSYTLVQQGNHNTIRQEETDPTAATGIMIRQQGNGMKLIIRNSTPLTP